MAQMRRKQLSLLLSLPLKNREDVNPNRGAATANCTADAKRRRFCRAEAVAASATSTSNTDRQVDRLGAASGLCYLAAALVSRFELDAGCWREGKELRLERCDTNETKDRLEISAMRDVPQSENILELQENGLNVPILITFFVQPNNRLDCRSSNELLHSHRNSKAYVETKSLLNSFVKSLSTVKGQWQQNSLKPFFLGEKKQKTIENKNKKVP